MAYSPRYIDTPNGRIWIRYLRPFRQVVPVQFCFLYTSGISHDCDEWGCWS
jgi:hypothetical protein